MADCYNTHWSYEEERDKKKLVVVVCAVAMFKFCIQI